MTDEKTQLTTGEPVPEDGSHREIDPRTGMQKGYVVLTPEERAKGFVKPVRRSYTHSGAPPLPTNLRDLTPEEHERYDQYGYIKYEPYDKPVGPVGKFWTQREFDRIGKGCGTMTTMGMALAETYARNPRFYSGTYCCGCGTHYPLNEFHWEPDGEPMDPNLQEEWAAQAKEQDKVELRKRIERLKEGIERERSYLRVAEEELAKLEKQNA